MRVIDIHTHVFPDAIAERAMKFLEEEGNVKARLDGKLSSLLASMDRAGIEIAVVGSIATKPEQFPSILKWSKSIASDRILPFPSVYPADPEAATQVRAIASEGFKGIKLHPYYQDFSVDEPRVFPIYEAMQDTGLVLLLHTGFDLAYPRTRIGDPVRIMRAVEAFPDLKLVATHFCAWEDWDEARKYMFGKPVYTDVSYSLHFMPIEQARGLVCEHSADYIVFGTDSPWADQSETLEFMRSLNMGPDWERKVLHGNAERILGLA